MNKGFSLVELIVVIAIMAILVGVAVPVYTSYITSANENVDRQAIGEIEHAIEVLLIDPDVDNPTVSGTITASTTYTITLGSNGTYTVTGATDTNNEFATALAALVPGVDLNTTDDVVFTVNAKSLTVSSNVDTIYPED